MASDYWKKRQELLQDRLMQKADDLIPEMEAKYNRAMRNIETEILSFYQRFANNEEISLADAKKFLNSEERKNFQMELDEYIQKGQENGISADWSKQLESASNIYRMDRLKALKIQMQQQVEELAMYKQQAMDKTLSEIYSEGYYRNIYEAQKLIGYGEPFSILDTQKINKVLAKPWTYDGKTYSDNIWNNRDTLSYVLDKKLTQAIIRGDAPDKVSREISKEVGVELNHAKRLVLTESAAFSAMSDKDAYKELDVEKFEYLATLDERTCDTCGPMDGQIFKMSEYEIGVTVPPLHPNCRCTTVPYFNDEFTVGEKRIARGTDGKAYEVPADMTYDQWKKEYVESSYENIVTRAAKEYNIRGEINISPKALDVSKYDFDNKHVKERQHDVSRVEAEKFIKEAKVSFTRWNGQFVCYVGSDGSTYVDVKNRLIKTAYKREQYDDNMFKFIKEVEQNER